MEEDCESGPVEGWFERRSEESDRLGFISECIDSWPGMSTPSEEEAVTLE